jgi:hypothetical protein
MSETFSDERDGTSGAPDATAQPRGLAAVVDEAKHQGEDIAQIAKERAAGFADQQKAAAARQVGDVAGAVEKTAEGLEETAPDIARYARIAATKARDVASALETRSVRDLVGTAEAYARREPAIFFGASIAAGFALARFLKSSPERPSADAAPEGAHHGA